MTKSELTKLLLKIENIIDKKLHDWAMSRLEFSKILKKFNLKTAKDAVRIIKSDVDLLYADLVKYASKNKIDLNEL